MPSNNGVLPRLWFFTDDRQSLAAIIAASMQLPRGSGIVVRASDPARQKSLLLRLRPLARRCGLVLSVSGASAGPGPGRHLGDTGRAGRYRGLVTASAHSLPQLRRAERAGAALVFVSPVFATRSHPQARPLGPLRLARLVRATRLPVIALGGMSRANWRRIRPSGALGWAAIDGLLDQKLMAVPR